MTQNETFHSGNSHGIFDSETNLRINAAQKVMIGNSVWLGYDTTILKGVEINDDSIASSGSIFTKYPEEPNVIFGDIPSNIIKREVFHFKKK